MVQKDEFKEKFKNAIINNFDISGEETDRFEAQCGLFGHLTKKLLHLIPPSQERPVLDVGCGTGISSRVIIDSIRNETGVMGVDISPEMLKKAKEKCPEVDFHLGDAEFLSHICSGPFGGVYYTACIFLLPDVRTSLAEASKIMVNGAAIAGSYMETLEGKEGEDLIASAIVDYPSLGMRHRKLFSFEELVTIFENLFRCVVKEEVRFKMGRKDAEGFFSIPAQSASLFPGQPVDIRLKKVKELFHTLDRNEYSILWKLVGGRK